MKVEKIYICNQEFYIIPDCKKLAYTLCVSAKSWGRSEWGNGKDGQTILDIVDNRNSKSITYEWYRKIPDKIKSGILTVKVNTNDHNTEGKGELLHTEIFVPSLEEWEKIPVSIRKIIVNYDCAWARTYCSTINNNNMAWCISAEGDFYANTYESFQKNNISKCFSLAVIPSFYISDFLLRGIKKE